MTRAIWKYDLGQLGYGVTILPLPRGGIIRHVGMQRRDAVTIWVEVEDSSDDYEYRGFRIIGTGSDIPENHEWRGTVLDKPYVWHVFESMGHVQ